MVSIPSAEIQELEVDRTCHVFINGRELPECETYAWFEAAIQEKAERERLDENGLVRCGCGGKAYMADLSMNGAHLYSVHCLDCNTQTDHCESREKAKTRWNTAHGYKA